MPLPQSSTLDNATIAITGASSGIGAEIARVLASRGYSVTLIARRKERLDELARELESNHGVKADVIAADMGDPASRADLAAQLESGPELIGFVNNAGLGVHGEFVKADADRERQMVEVNIDAVHDLAIRVLPGMVKRGRGSLLNTASTASAQPVPYMATYAATKAFVISFSEALSVEVRGSGVSVTALCPGPVKTEFAQVAGSESFEDNAPGMTFVKPEDVARQAVDAMIRGDRTITPGIANKVSIVAGRVAPRGIVMKLAADLTGYKK